jgi:hypothetical protein
MTTMVELARRITPYALPTVDLHRLLVRWALDADHPDHQGPMNQLHHTTLATLSPGASEAGFDTPCSVAWVDLRGGPALLTIAPPDGDRRVSARLIDLYGESVDLSAPDAAGAVEGPVLIEGQAASRTDDGPRRVVCPTHLALIVIRVEQFGEGDAAAARSAQHGVALSAVSPPPPMRAWPGPVDVRERLGVDFLRAYDWMLDFMPERVADHDARQDLTGLGLGTAALEAILAEPAIAAEIAQGLEAGRLDIVALSSSAVGSLGGSGPKNPQDVDMLARAVNAYRGLPFPSAYSSIHE